MEKSDGLQFNGWAAQVVDYESRYLALASKYNAQEKEKPM